MLESPSEIAKSAVEAAKGTTFAEVWHTVVNSTIVVALVGALIRWLRRKPLPPPKPVPPTDNRIELNQARIVKLEAGLAELRSENELEHERFGGTCELTKMQLDAHDLRLRNVEQALHVLEEINVNLSGIKADVGHIAANQNVGRERQDRMESDISQIKSNVAVALDRTKP